MKVEQTMQAFMSNQESNALIAPFAQEAKPSQRVLQELSHNEPSRAELPPDERVV